MRGDEEGSPGGVAAHALDPEAAARPREDAGAALRRTT